MASYGDESLDSYLYTSYNPYSYRCPRPKGWRHKSYLAAYGDSDSYLDTYHRAQLKSILSQINPNLTPRLRKANTRDVAVQVNPKAHVSIQCSLGPRTLLQVRRRDSPRARRIDGQAPGSPGSNSSGGSPGGVRFPRTQAVYSPIASRGLASFLQEEQEEEERRGAEEEKEEKQQQQEKNKERRSSKQAKDELSPDKSMEGSEQTGAVDGSKSEAEKSGQEETKIKGRVRFQFLEQKYGYYHCRDCNLRWESAYVWCVQGTNKVYFKQFCRTCQKSFNPYRVEDITCHSCKKARCTCPGTARHVDPKRPHRQDLCGRCKGKRLSCDSTFSFKYII